ncbi:hydrogenase maturation protease [Actinoplanes sp. NPDC023714]|uniref:hydrogenase maturation protease n=1 Tax=Actinoplanes sp. NPDC023714 TaxID=3154322 RepID=UPI0033DB1F5D
MGAPVVIGVGNEYRHDDGFGVAVVAELAFRAAHDDRLAGVRLRVNDGEPTRMLDAWSGAGLAVVVDVAPGQDGQIGRWQEVTLPDGLRPDPAAASGHGIGLNATIALAQALDCMPQRLVVLVTFGGCFQVGAGLSAPVAAAIDPVADRICTLVTGS